MPPHNFCHPDIQKAFAQIQIQIDLCNVKIYKHKKNKGSSTFKDKLPFLPPKADRLQKLSAQPFVMFHNFVEFKVGIG